MEDLSVVKTHSESFVVGRVTGINIYAERHEIFWTWKIYWTFQENAKFSWNILNLSSE